MATGGIFTLITNDGKQDRMLMATALLLERLTAINQYKVSTNGGSPDDLQNLPTLLDIEKTHVLFTNAHFKPFAAIGFEYNKVKITSGSSNFGQHVQFSIPQFGDFFHDTCCHVIMQQPTLSTTATTSSDQPLMRWCAFPGEALLQHVTQEVNGNPLDDYYFHSVNFHREFRVAPNKMDSWYRCVGQELPNKGYVQTPNWVANGVAASSVVDRIAVDVFNGNQTPTGQKNTTSAGQLEMFIPLLFWYNTDVRLAVPSVAIPYGQRFINVDIANLNQMVDVVPRGAGTWAAPLGSVGTATLSTFELYINNIFVNPEVHKIYIKRIGFSLIRVHRQQLYTANSNTTDILLQQLKWPIEYLCVGMKLQNYFASSDTSQTRQYLDRWHTFSTVNDVTTSTLGQSMYQEYAVCPTGVTFAVAVTTGAITIAGGATAYTVPAFGLLKIAGILYTVSATISAGATTTSAVVSPIPTVAAVAATSDVTLMTPSPLQVAYKTYSNNMDSVTIKAHGISIYDTYPSGFFNAYVPYHYGGPNLCAPKYDTGALFIPFCLYPGTYQPSGHINVSRAREFYITYTSSTISTNNIGVLVVVASAINFLLISDGSAVLRYST